MYWLIVEFLVPKVVGATSSKDVLVEWEHSYFNAEFLTDAENRTINWHPSTITTPSRTFYSALTFMLSYVKSRSSRSLSRSLLIRPKSANAFVSAPSGWTSCVRFLKTGYVSYWSRSFEPHARFLPIFMHVA